MRSIRTVAPRALPTALAALWLAGLSSCTGPAAPERNQGSSGSGDASGAPGTGGAGPNGGNFQGGGSGSGGSNSVGGTSAGGTGAGAAGGSPGVGGSTSDGGSSAGSGGTGKGGGPGTGAGGTPSDGGSSGAETVGGSGAGGSAGTSGGAGGGAPVGSGRIYYVTPKGKATNDGTSFASAMDFATARSRVVAGDTILLEAGTYQIAYVADAKNTITLSQTGKADDLIRVVADGGRAKFDFSFPEQAWVQDSFGFALTGSYWYFNGIDITHAGYQGVYVTGQHNTFENCAFYENRNTGLEINKGGAYTTVINSDAYRNYDPKKLGSMADGFGPKETQGPGNRFIGCRAWENSDDGYDAFESPERVTFEGCSAFKNGIDVWNYGGFDGNGNGFKVGGNAAQANHQLSGCIAFANRVKGFDQNNNTGGITLYNCTGYQNGTNFGLGGTLNAGQMHVLENNISLGGTSADSVANATQATNSWSSGFSVSAADFLSVDVLLGSAPRASDGGLPHNDFLRLKPTSALIDRGTDVGLPFLGAGPDLGAFEAK